MPVVVLVVEARILLSSSSSGYSSGASGVDMTMHGAFPELQGGDD